MLPEPVDTESSTRPLTDKLRSNVCSEASAGTAASANAAVARRRCFIGFLISSEQGSGTSDRSPESRDRGPEVVILRWVWLHPACQTGSAANPITFSQPSAACSFCPASSMSAFEHTCSPLNSLEAIPQESAEDPGKSPCASIRGPIRKCSLISIPNSLVRGPVL